MYYFMNNISIYVVILGIRRKENMLCEKSNVM